MPPTTDPPFIWPRPQVTNERLPKWLCKRLHNVAVKYVHYESSLGGPHNELLHCYFPTAMGKMVKPIPRLRKMAAPGVTGSRVSADSYNRSVATRKDDDVPDFVVCNATEDLHNDRAFLIWELKRDDEEYMKTSLQIERYEKWLIDYAEFIQTEGPGKSPELWLGLVEKGMVQVTKLDVTVCASAPRMSNTVMVEVLSEDLHAILEHISETNP